MRSIRTHSDNIGHSKHDWHHVDAETVQHMFRTNSSGLSNAAALERLKKYGRNIIAIKKSHAVWIILWRQISNPIIYALLGAAILAFMLKDMADALVILSVVVFNSIIGFFQEYKAHRTIEALQSKVPDRALVIRSGIKGSIPTTEVVPGDILALQAGDTVPADALLLSAAGLKCDESMLTGESASVEKHPHVLPASTPLAERTNLVFKGTHITSGSGSAVVVATGLQTELGKISEMIEKVLPLETPLARNLKKMTQMITLGILLISGCIFLVGWLRGAKLYDAVFSAIALAVAAIPEGFPAVITISAAIGVQRMAKRKAVIRQLPAVEALGSTTVICTDKTGTLTENQMTVQKIWTPSGYADVTGIGYDLSGQVLCDKNTQEKQVWQLLQAGILCNDAVLKHSSKKHIDPIGDPTEIALLVAAKKAGIEVELFKTQWEKISEIPFTSEHKVMQTLCKHEHSLVIFMKGSPEAIIHASSSDPSKKKEDFKIVEEMAKNGYRVLGLAEKKTQKTHLDHLEKQGFSLLGFVGMIDPPRKEIARALETCRSAGIIVKMITGDHPATASAVSRFLGISSDDQVVTGLELDQLSKKEWQEVSEHFNVFARVDPQHKLSLVSALQKQGHVVAMTGDGVNDAPALKKADIGIAMGIRGTAVAKEASDMILMTDNFANIEAAVEEGRRVYDNLVKAIQFIFATGLGQALIIFFAVLFFPLQNGRLTHPILPVQILWINLIVAAGLAVPLAFEQMEPDIMKRPPRNKNALLIDRTLLFNACIAAIGMAISSIVLYLWQKSGSSTNISPSMIESKSQTIALTSLVFIQIVYLIDCRSFSAFWPNFSFAKNWKIAWGILSVLALQIFFIYTPFMNRLFHSSPLNGKDWLAILFSSGVISILISLRKQVPFTKKTT
jgi:calcium-translocating P-type ATPase